MANQKFGGSMVTPTPDSPAGQIVGERTTQAPGMSSQKRTASVTLVPRSAYAKPAAISTWTGGQLNRVVAELKSQNRTLSPMPIHPGSTPGNADDTGRSPSFAIPSRASASLMPSGPYGHAAMSQSANVDDTGRSSNSITVGPGIAALMSSGSRRQSRESAAAAPTNEQVKESVFRPFRSPPPFYWVQTVETISEFEVLGSFGEVVTKLGDFMDDNNALPIAGTLRMAKGGLYNWTFQVVKQCPHRPHLLFGVQGGNHARPWRLVSSGRCSRSRDDGPWVSRPGGDLVVRPGDYLHCEVDLRGLDSPLGSLSFAVNAGPFETAFEDIPLSDGPIHPVLCMGGGGTTCRLCAV